jgi:hypothetical protein
LSAINDLPLEFGFELPQLRRREFVVENHHIDIELGARRGKAGQLAAADEGRRIGLLALLQHAQHHRRTGGVSQTGELLE